MVAENSIISDGYQETALDDVVEHVTEETHQTTPESLLPNAPAPVYGSLPDGNHAPRGEPQLTRSQSVCGCTVSFHNISYTVKTKEDGKKINKVILNDVSGVFGPGMNAILGPTGSGKTSLLDVLAARKDPKGLSGTVLIDGRAQPKNFKLVSGYVVQDDVVMGTLTVRENLEFSANLRLTKAVSKEERKQRVQDVINELGLNLCSETKVGTEFIRGVSGGERKRTNVGMELITKPTVLFLDEPTTGLDASTANAVMLLLSKLTKRGRTIIFSIHQPRYSIYKLFDRMHLLALGNTVYHGMANQALEYFSENGYVCEEHNNPPDFFLDIINGDSSAVTMALENGKAADTVEDNNETVVNINSKPDSLSDKLSRLFKMSELNNSLTEEANQIYKEYSSTEEVETVVIEYPTSFATQLYYVSKRTVLNILRNPMQTYIQFGFMVIFGLVVGGLYFQLDLSTAGIQNRVGAFFFLIMNMVFSNLSAVELFIKERVIFVHESASGFYRCSAYFFAKVFCDLLPMRIIPTLIFCAITYWMIGLKAEVDAFFFFALTMILTTVTACALSFAISSSVSIMAIATLFVAVCYIFMMIFSGLLLNIETLPEWLQWLQYVSIFRYSLNALSVNELRGLEFCTFVNGTKINCFPGEDYLDQQGIDDTDWGLWQNNVALGSMSVIFLVLGYIQLRRIHKLK
ncbi:broad substrate specificity ATP-binding cassette transporter ABCG2-like isoform X2 [Patiria miniata]|uniref:ABC transporter domain-containing protein n=1 Tax=Patiria miniata TaxID=46514 RepID=A0A914AAN6_PATMI|nr:broad substrate specificity ATP-binding cassette transporter ABCG2-like isoform X2 [Patiria miniata]